MTDTTSAAPSEQDLFERVFPMPEGCMRCGDTYAPTEYSAWAASAFIERFKGWQAARRAQPTPPAVVEPPELSPDFTDTARAALLWVLWHHQGGSSPVGQPIRFALGMGQHDRLNEHQLAEAKRWERLHPVNPAVFPRGPEPLTLEAINAMAREHPAEDLCGWSYRMGIADAERHHGIKGGQHGAE